MTATTTTRTDSDPVDAEAPRAGGLRPLSIVTTLLATLFVAAAFFGLFAFGFSGLQEQRSQHVLYASLRGLLDPANPVAPSIGGVIPSGTPVALLSSKAAGLRNVVVVAGTTSGDLLEGPGLLSDSPLPGQVGESIVMGKSATAGAPFRDVPNLKKGDTITVTTGQGTFHFVVEGTRVAGDPLPSIPPSGSLLTLVTAKGQGWLGSVEPSRVVYVDAVLQGQAVTSPPGRPQSVNANEVQGASDTGALPWVILWLVILGAGAVTMMWLSRRWGFWRSWLIGAPIMLAVLWALSNEGMRLLPNIY